MGSVTSALAAFGIEPSAPAQQAMRQWSAVNQPGRHGSHQYQAEDFGLHEESLAAVSNLYFCSPEARLSAICRRTVTDFNGDGLDDLLIGAYRADGPLNARNYAGDSYLIFGDMRYQRRSTWRIWARPPA